MATKTVLVTGATGFIGRHLVRHLASLGLNVFAASRKPTKDLELEGLKHVTLDLASPSEEFLSILEHTDVVVHLAGLAHGKKDTDQSIGDPFEYVNCELAKNLANDCEVRGVKQFIFISSIGVSGSKTELGQPLNENMLPNPHNNYAQSKLKAELEIEQICLDTSMNYTIFRPVLVCGLDAPGTFGALIRMVALPFPLPLGAKFNRRSYLSSHNFCTLIEAALLNEKSFGQIYLAADSEIESTYSVTNAMKKRLKSKAIIIPIPKSVRLLAGVPIIGAISQQLFGDLEVDNSKAREDLGWKADCGLVKQLSAGYPEN